MFVFLCFTKGDRPGNSLFSQPGSEKSAAERFPFASLSQSLAFF
jgi:hypothetical protein